MSIWMKTASVHDGCEKVMSVGRWKKGHTNSRYETLILLPIWDLKDYRTSEHFIRQSQHCNRFGWLFVVTVSAATQADDESDD